MFWIIIICIVAALLLLGALRSISHMLGMVEYGLEAGVRASDRARERRERQQVLTAITGVPPKRPSQWKIFLIGAPFAIAFGILLAMYT